MPFIEMPINDGVEKTVVPEGTYELVIDDAREPKEGQNSVCVRLSIVNEPNAKAVFHYISLVSPDDDDDKRNNKLLFAKAFLNAFNIPYTDEGFSTEDMFGATGRVPLIQDEYNGVPNNKIQLSI